MEAMIAAMDVAAGATQAAEQLAGKSDRYLFILALVVLGLFVVWGVKFLVNQNADLVKQLREAQGRYEAKLEVIIEKSNSTREQLTQAMNRNTEIVERCIINKMERVKE